MPFLALLKLLSPKEWLVVAALMALLAGGGWLYRHGEQHIQAQDVKIAAIDQKKVTAVETAATSTESQNALIWKQAVSIPPVPDIGIVCRKASGSVLPPADAGKGAAASNATADSGVGPPYDPSGAALTRGHKADAQIIYLQGRIRELESEMNGAP